MKENHIENITETNYYKKTESLFADGTQNYTDFLINIPENELMNVKMFGYEICAPDKRERVHTFECNTMHFILRGQGWFDGILLQAGDGFMVRKNHMSEYCPDSADPWTYVWINFDGSVTDSLLDMVGLTEGKCTFSMEDNRRVVRIIREALNRSYHGTDIGMYMNAALLQIFSCMTVDIPDTFTNDNSESVMENRVKNSIHYITKHYKEKNCLDKLIEREKVSKRYLARLFKLYSDNSPQGHIIRLRIEESKKLLRTTVMTVGEVGSAVGYDDVLQFSKIFRKHTGVSPSAYKKGHKDIIRQYE